MKEPVPISGHVSGTAHALTRVRERNKNFYKIYEKTRRHKMTKSMRAERDRIGTGLDITNVDKLTQDASEVGIGVITVLAALIGIWGIACLIGAVAHEGLLETIQGYMSAVTGR